MKNFEIAAGSVVGRDHVIAGKNSQDAYAVVQMPARFDCEARRGGIVAVICDGCGSRPSSEVGAKIGARIVADAVMRYGVYGFDTCGPDAREIAGEWRLRRVHVEVLKQLRQIARAMGRPLGEPRLMAGGELCQVVNDFLLFTIVGAVVMDLATWTFSIGDGVVAVNGNVRRLGPFPGNEPPYLGYNLLSSSLRDVMRFQVHDVLPTEAVQSVLIGSDGVGDLMEREGQKIPGRDEIVGPLAQFWTEDRYFKNPDMIRRRLAMMNREATTINWENRGVEKEVGLLPDDTTMVVIRRKVHE